MKSSRNIQQTKKYLKDNDLLAIPFDKGIGICIMKKEAYHQKLDKIIKGDRTEMGNKRGLFILQTENKRKSTSSFVWTSKSS